MPTLQDRFQQFLKKYFSTGRRVSPQALKHMGDSLTDESRLDRSFILMTVGSCVIATLGLLSNSAAVIIGAMLIAPLMLPIRGLSFGILEADRDLIETSAKALAVGTLLSIALSTLIGRVINLSEYDSEVWARTSPTILDLGIAIAAGAIAGFAKLDEKISGTMAGTAIAVALMPPLCVVGLWLAKANLPVAMGALLLFITNLMGITLACMVVFFSAGYFPIKRVRRPLALTLTLTSLLLIPLGFTSSKLIRQDRLESELRRALLEGTVTFQRVRLLSLETDWGHKIPVVTLSVSANTPVTPTQVGLLEDFLEREMGQQFRLKFEVSQVDEVDSDSIRYGAEQGNTPRPQGWQQN
jgi:uncharacterized hydrophobic protein (TIGR00271 family)